MMIAFLQSLKDTNNQFNVEGTDPYGNWGAYTNYVNLGGGVNPFGGQGGDIFGTGAGNHIGGVNPYGGQGGDIFGTGAGNHIGGVNPFGGQGADIFGTGAVNPIGGGGVNPFGSNHNFGAGFPMDLACPQFPNACDQPTTIQEIAELLEPPVNIPYCQR